MNLSFERLQSAAAAGLRKNARATLALAQAISAGMGDAKAWRSIQQRLINQSNTGLA